MNRQRKTTNRAWLRFDPVVLLTWLVGCQDPAAQEDPPAYMDPAGGQIQIAFQEGDLVLGGIVYRRDHSTDPCQHGQWFADNLPPGDPVLLDLYFPWGYSYPVPSHVATLKEEFVQDVRELRGSIVREFNLSVVRAWVPRSSFARFVEYGVLDHARSVPDPDRYDVRISILADGGRETEVKQMFGALGGEITHESEKIPYFGGIMPDAAVPDFLSSGGIEEVSLQWFRNPLFCMRG